MRKLGSYLHQPRTESHPKRAFEHGNGCPSRPAPLPEGCYHTPVTNPLPPTETALSDRLRDVRAVLFDLDGTLLDTIELILSSFRHATFEVLGEKIPDAVLMRNIGIPLRVQMREFTADPIKADEMLDRYREHNAEIHDGAVAAFPGVRDMLTGVRDLGLPMGVVTSKSRALAERGLEITGLGCYFDTLVTSDDTDRHKPDPYPLLVAADALGVHLRYCVYVGDSPHDVRAAVDGGAVSVAATWGVSNDPELVAEGPDVVIDSVAELLPLLSHNGQVGRRRAGE
jgi:pyrophosphatase PpaX